MMNFLNWVLFYPLFLWISFLYSVGYRIASLVQYIFTVIYVQQICGFKRREKIISLINSFSKVPQDMAIVYSINKLMIQGEQNYLSTQQIERKIMKEHLEILAKIQLLNNITIYLDSQSEYLPRLVHTLQNQISAISTKKHITVINKQQAIQQQSAYLQMPNKSYIPFLMVFSDYESVCNIPSKYLVNAEIAFNPSIFNSNKYDIFKSFAQYASSKQRNGK